MPAWVTRHAPCCTRSPRLKAATSFCRPNRRRVSARRFDYGTSPNQRRNKKRCSKGSDLRFLGGSSAPTGPRKCSEDFDPQTGITPGRYAPKCVTWASWASPCKRGADFGRHGWLVGPITSRPLDVPHENPGRAAGRVSKAVNQSGPLHQLAEPSESAGVDDVLGLETGAAGRENAAP